MALPAIDIDPQASATTLAGLGAGKLGLLYTGPDGGLYMPIKAHNAISANALCRIIRTPGQDEVEAEEISTGRADHPYALCIPQRGLFNDRYGWGLVWGHGYVEAGGVGGNANRLFTSVNHGRVDDTARRG